MIFQSIDDNEQANLKIISDGVFGDDNFITQIPRLTSPQRPSQENYISIQHDYVMLHAKSKDDGSFARTIKRDGIDKAKQDHIGLYFEGDTSPILASATQGYSAGGDYDFEYNGITYKPIASDGTRRRWLWTRDRMEEASKLGILVPTKNGLRVRNYLNKEFQVKTNKMVDKDINLIFTTYDLMKSSYANSKGTDDLSNQLLKFSFSKPTSLISECIKLIPNKYSTILDYFAGSGTTAHAVINLNREDGGSRKYILVEQGEYFDTVLKPRVQKVIFSENWKDGVPVGADKSSSSSNFNGISQMVKVLKLESYEDTLNNLELKRPDLFQNLPASTQQDYLLNYMLNIESKNSLLNVANFQKPFNYQLNIATTSAGAYQPQTIDLIETFNYLIGAEVLSVNDKREEQGYVIIKCRLPHQANTDQKTLIFWRDCERVDYDNLQVFLKEKMRIDPTQEDYAQIYINGDHNIETVWEGERCGVLKINSIEETFLQLMFAGA